MKDTVHRPRRTLASGFRDVVKALLRRASAADRSRLVKLVLTEASVDDAELYKACREYADRYNNENNGDMHANGEVAFMKDWLPNCDVVFDVGANVGSWAALAVQFNPGIRLHCFEPSKPTFLTLVGSGLPGDVTYNHCGLGSKPEDLTLRIFEEGAGINSLYERKGLEDGWKLAPQLGSETVRIITLDRYCADNSIDRIDFLKLDVEGHELEVLKGSSDMFHAGRIEVMQFEYGGCNIDARVLLKDMFEFFEPLTYSFFKLYPTHLRPVSRYDQRLENFQYQNWLIVQNSSRYLKSGSHMIENG